MMKIVEQSMMHATHRYQDTLSLLKMQSRHIFAG